MTAAIIIVAAVGLLMGCEKRPPEHPRVTAVDGGIVIPLSQVDDGRVHFYTYKHGGKRINFLVRTDGKGTLSAFFDACFTCYRNKKGYHEEGTDLVCNECKMRFRLADEKWDNSTGCSPILIKSRIENKNLIIQAADLEKGVKLF